MNDNKNIKPTNIVLSIIIPCYNVSPYIDRCLHSIFNQYFRKDTLQVLLINDASTDDTYNKLLHWEQLYPNQILLFNNEHNMRQGTSRNIGIHYATGKYIGFVDADDWIEPNMYEKLITIAEYANCDIVSCNLTHSQNKNSSSATQEHDIVYYMFDDNNRSDFIASETLNTYVVTKVYRRSFILENSIFFPQEVIFEDHFFIEMLKVYLSSVAILEDELYHYCATPNSTVRCHNSAAHFDIIKTSKYLWAECTSRGLFQKPFGSALEYRLIYYYWFVGSKMLVVFHNPIPYDTLIQIKSDIIEMIPDFRENIYLTDYFVPQPLTSILTKILSLPLSKSEFIQLIDKIKKINLF
ncbi:glycosyltransferase family 2 protein [Lachnospiraceae bacterium OttesenSCG-928-D06]|nr:glycosyltransferase family 2 protein [Lachnospiraceae bacterium OttesenSCG-928-D06]